MDIKDLRYEIDLIDAEIVRLYTKRMSVSEQIAEHKKENGIPILDSVRETELLDKVGSLAGKELEEYIRAVYKTILATSREHQAKKQK